MDTLVIGDKKYLKATAAARETGYTADYIGQLCRAHKIDAKLVGRSWYVSEEAIADHKKGKVRSNIKTTRREVEKALEARAGEIHGTIEKPSYEPEYRKRIIDSNIKYQNDDEGLLPELAPVVEERAIESEEVPSSAIEPKDVELPEVSEDFSKNDDFSNVSFRAVTDHDENEPDSASEEAQDDLGEETIFKPHIEPIEDFSSNAEPYRPTLEINDSEFESKASQYQREVHHTPERRRSILPVASLAVFVAGIIAVNAFIENSWDFRKNTLNDRFNRPTYTSAYQISNLASISDSIQSLK